MDSYKESQIDIINKSILALIQGKSEDALNILDQISPDLQTERGCGNIVNNLMKFIQQYQEGTTFINSLADGNLDIEAPDHNYIISHYKQLQSNLRHLTWQTQQIAKGDYNQQVVYLGAFSVAFNKLISDLKEKKQMQEELKELYATREKFISIISHDLKSPFNGILGFADILRQDYLDLTDEARKQYIDHIYNSARNAFKLLENLLDWSRIQTGKIKFSPDELNLSRLVLENFLLHRPAAEKKQIHLYSEVPPDAIVYADYNSLLTVIRNLVNNAIKFTNPGGKVVVSSEKKDPFIEVMIRDTGVGISPGNLIKLFKLGDTLKTEGTEKEKGTGLGLLLCKEFIEKNGGTIRAESEPGVGSRFFFTIPAYPDTKSINY